MSIMWNYDFTIIKIDYHPYRDDYVDFILSGLVTVSHVTEAVNHWIENPVIHY